MSGAGLVSYVLALLLTKQLLFFHVIQMIVQQQQYGRVVCFCITKCCCLLDVVTSLFEVSISLISNGALPLWTYLFILSYMFLLGTETAAINEI